MLKGYVGLHLEELTAYEREEISERHTVSLSKQVLAST